MRYKYLRSFLMVLGVVLLMPQGMHAQNIDDFKKDTTSFNALDHLITPRYRTPHLNGCVYRPVDAVHRTAP